MGRYWDELIAKSLISKSARVLANHSYQIAQATLNGDTPISLDACTKNIRPLAGFATRSNAANQQRERSSAK